MTKVKMQPFLFSYLGIKKSREKDVSSIDRWSNWLKVGPMSKINTVIDSIFSSIKVQFRPNRSEHRRNIHTVIPGSSLTFFLIKDSKSNCFSECTIEINILHWVRSFILAFKIYQIEKKDQSTETLVESWRYIIFIEELLIANLS